TQVFDLQANPQLICNASWMLETRSSKELTADLKDFVGGSFNIAPTVDVSDDAVCEGGSGSLTATLYDANSNPIANDGYVFTWSGPGSFSGQGTATITFDPASLSDAGQYSVTVTSDTNCVPSSPSSGSLTVYPETSDVNDNTTVCAGDSYVWSYNGLSYTAADSPVALNETDGNGCPFTATLVINEYPVTQMYTDSYTVCDGESWTFSYDSDGDGADENYGPYSAGVHTENVFDSNGCPYQLEFTVNEYPVTQMYSDSYTVCDGESWTFSYDSDGDGADENYGPYSAGVHTEILFDPTGCPYKVEFVINEYPVTQMYSDSYTVCDGESWTFSYDSDGDGADENYALYGARVNTENVFDSNGCPYQLEFTVNEYPVTQMYSDSYTVCDGES